jgi:hypothetical protein
MESKVCSKCNIEKEVCNFHKWKYGPDGYKRDCKECRKIETKTYYKNNNENIKLVVSNYRKNNQDKVKKLGKKIYERDKERILMVNKKYKDNNKDKIKLISKKFREKNDEKIKEKKKYYTKNKENIKIINKNYRENNREKRNEYQKNRKLNDPIFKLNHTIRNRMRSFLLTKNITKKNKTFNIVGCTPLELKEHLEKQFTDGMSWDNKSKWHIDHIIPLSSGNTEEDILKLFHYTNLQPLWAIDNMKKGSKTPF